MRLTGVLLLLLCGEAGAAEGKLKVAMLELRAAAGVPQSTVNLLGEVIATDAARSEKHELMSVKDVAAVLSIERQKQLLGCSDDTSCIAEIGSALGADLLLDVSIGAVGNLRVIALRLIDTKTGSALRRESESVPDDGQLVDACHRLTARLFDLPLPSARRSRIVPGFVVLGGAAGLAIGGIVVGSLVRSDVTAFGMSVNEADASRAMVKAGVADGLYGGALLAAGIAAFLIITGFSAPAEGSGGP